MEPEYQQECPRSATAGFSEYGAGKRVYTVGERETDCAIGKNKAAFSVGIFQNNICIYLRWTFVSGEHRKRGGPSASVPG
jgi:hypothetical protein